jgi:hypothetical protein
MTTVLHAALPGCYYCCRALPSERRGVRPGRRRGGQQRRSRRYERHNTTPPPTLLRDAFPCEEEEEESSDALFSEDPTMENNSTAADAHDDDGVVVFGDDDDDDDDDDDYIDIDDAHVHRRRSLVRRRHCRDLEARRHVLASFAILAVEWIRTYVPIRAVAAKMKRMYDRSNDRAAALGGRPSSDWGTTHGGDTDIAAGKGRSASRFALRFKVKGRTRPPPPSPPLSISTPSTRRPRVDAGQILTRLEGRKSSSSSSSSILFASDGTKLKAPMEILNSPRMMSRLRERGNNDD